MEQHPQPASENRSCFGAFDISTIFSSIFSSSKDRPQQEDNISNSSEDEYDDNLEKMVQERKFSFKRSAVSAEVFGIFNKKENFKAKAIPKSVEKMDRIRSMLCKSFLFQNLEEKEMTMIIMAMEERKFSFNEEVIKQGADGDYLYIVENGNLDCFKEEAVAGSNNPKKTLLKTYQPGEVFGELALLYNAPRAATVVSNNQSTLYALDRETFIMIAKDSAMSKREKNEELLQKVSLFKTMSSYELLTVADALKTKFFKKGETIFKEGDPGNCFYILIEGEAKALKRSANGIEVIVMEYKTGGYFGELALLNNDPRAASIVAVTDIKVAYLDRDSFTRLMGPVEDLMKRNAEKYSKV